MSAHRNVGCEKIVFRSFRAAIRIEGSKGCGSAWLRELQTETGGRLERTVRSIALLAQFLVLMTRSFANEDGFKQSNPESI